MIINAGIIKIIYLNSYPDELARELLKEAKIEEIHYVRKTEKKIKIAFVFGTRPESIKCIR